MMRTKNQKKQWRRQIAKWFPSAREEMRREIKAIDNRMPKPSVNNDWRVLVIHFEAD
jgi:hypothetical protein